MEKCSLQSSEIETQTQCEATTDSDSDQRVEKNTKSIESLKTDDAAGLSGAIGFPLKVASYPSLRIHCTLKVIRKIKKYLNDENLEKFEQSCFGHLLKLNVLNELRFQGRLVRQLLLQMDMGLSNEERLVFRVHDSKIEFGPSDFSLITSLRCYGTSETPSSSSIHKNVFQSSPDIRLRDIKKAFITASRVNEGQGQRTLKLALLYFLYGILLPIRGNGRITQLDMKYLHLVEDLEKFNAFPWGRVAYELLAKSILSIRRRMDGSKGAIKFFDISGFPHALQTWAYEMMPSVATYCASRVSKLGYQTPVILCWSATKQTQLCHDYLNKLLTLGDDAHLKIKIRMGKSKCAPLSRRQLKKSKLKCDNDTRPHTGPTYPRNHPTRNILLERNKSMRMRLNKLKAEKWKLEKKFEDSVPKEDDFAAAVESEKEEINKSLADGKAHHEVAMRLMSAEVDAIHDHSLENGSLERGSRSLAHSGAAAECPKSDVAVHDTQCKESDHIRGCSDGEAPKVDQIIEISSDDETPDDDSCSDAYMESLVATFQGKEKRRKMDV